MYQIGYVVADLPVLSSRFRREVRSYWKRLGKTGQLLHPGSASVGSDSEESALRNSSYLPEDALISTTAMTMFELAMLILAFSAKANL
jgi:hypothetical protein